MKKTLFILYLSLSAFYLIAQQQAEAIIYNKGNINITLDGNADDWNNVSRIEIDKVFKGETPSLDSAYWKAVWSDQGLYVLVVGYDDIWYPSWEWATGWAFDKVAVFIDVSYPQLDGLGAKDLQGNYIISPNFSENDQGTTKEYVIDGLPEGTGIMSADTYDGNGSYIIEYFIPFTAIPTNNAEIVNPLNITTIGFDVTIQDVDISDQYNRAVWSNVGDIDESWNNCDQVGLITFSPNNAVGVSSNLAESKILASNIIANEIRTLVEAKNFTIYNNLGTKVFQAKNSTHFNISRLQSGAYIAKITYDKNQIYIERFIKE